MRFAPSFYIHSIHILFSWTTWVLQFESKLVEMELPLCKFNMLITDKLWETINRSHVVKMCEKFAMETVFNWTCVASELTLHLECLLNFICLVTHVEESQIWQSLRLIRYPAINSTVTTSINSHPLPTYNELNWITTTLEWMSTSIRFVY